MKIVTKITDEVQNEVNRIWTEKPGIGVKDLMNHLESLQLSTDITKQRVKAAKQAVPYRFIEPEGDIPESQRDINVEFVERKIEERTSVRSLRRYKESDEILKGLTAMGIILDDGMRTWTIGKKEIPGTQNDSLNNAEIATLQNSGIACQFCDRYFASKNLVFRHLRDVSSSCGNAIFANGQKLPDAPSDIAKRERQEAAKALRRKKTGKAKQHSDPLATLWFGDLPIPYTRLGGQYKRLRAVLREYLPRDVPQPWIKKVVRKAYRKGGKISRDQSERGTYFGYAIVIFRDEEEANKVKASMDGVEIKTQNVFPPDYDYNDIPSFVLKVSNVQHDNVSDVREMEQDSITSGGQDPPLIDQLRPLSLPELEERCRYLRERLEVDGKILVDTNESDDKKIVKSSDQEHDLALTMAVSLYGALNSVRREYYHQGRIIPEDIRENLLHLLKNVRWPAETHRKGLTSDNYMVLQTNVTNDRFYNDLRMGCRELMNWADPDYFYSGIAVTKNFVASPHIDDRDQSFQYAVSLGDFKGGGQLCVEGRDDDNIDYVNVVDTKNRIARVDGRNVHWVRSWNNLDSGDRYSLIFYDTTEKHRSDILNSGIDINFITE